jgi:hypothetical protein
VIRTTAELRRVFARNPAPGPRDGHRRPSLADGAEEPPPCSGSDTQGRERPGPSGDLVPAGARPGAARRRSPDDHPRSPLLLAPLAALCALALLLLAAPGAQAAETIAGPGSGAGKVNFPLGAAVDNNPASSSYRDLYVADRNNFRIDKFDPEGDFLLAWGFGVADGKSAELQTCGPQTSHPRCFAPNTQGINTNLGAGNIIPGAVAVDQASHDVYVADSEKRRLTKFGPDGEFIFMAGKGVDQGGGSPAHPGDVCKAEYLEQEQPDTCGAGQNGSGAGEFFSSPGAMTVDASGHVWVLDGSRIDELDSSGSFLSQVPIAAPPRRA